MYIEIKFPDECDTLEKKKEFVQGVYKWGLENIIDQESWSYFILISGLIRAHTTELGLNIDNEIDAMAVKLTWS